MDGRFHFIETGSLVTLKTQTEDVLIPSEEERIDMNPMDFEEFCWALGDMVTVDFARKCFDERKPLGPLNETVMRRYCEYLCVGGMPQAVAEYAAKRDLTCADLVKRDILKLYRDDISKFAKGNAARVRRIFDEIPGQLTKKEKKYSLASLIRRSGRICPVEVKSGRYQSHVSLDRFRSKFGDRHGPAYILYTKDVMERDGIVHPPLYMTMFL